jgi:cellulose synthase/poly-beta-1,6-N-acetylglucosamine synthase-like glycosyltransferase
VELILVILQERIFNLFNFDLFLTSRPPPLHPTDKKQTAIYTTMPSNDDSAQQPLLSAGITCDAVDPSSNTQAVNPTEVDPNDTSAFKTWYRNQLQWLQGFLASRTQHFCVLGLVSLDLLGIFADIFINLYTCEEGEPSPTWDAVRNMLGIAGLVFSCLFMVELILSVWAFGWRSDFLSPFISRAWSTMSYSKVLISLISAVVICDKLHTRSIILTTAQIFHLLLPHR